MKKIGIALIAIGIVTTGTANLLQHNPLFLGASLTHRALAENGEHPVIDQFKQQAPNNMPTGGGRELAGFTCPSPQQIRMTGAKMGGNKAIASATANMPPALGQWASSNMTTMRISDRPNFKFVAVSLANVNSTVTRNGSVKRSGVVAVPACTYTDVSMRPFVEPVVLLPQNYPAIHLFTYRLSSGGQRSSNIHTQIVPKRGPQANLGNAKEQFESSPAAENIQQRLSGRERMSSMHQ